MYYQKHLLICTNQRGEGKACCGNHHAAEAAKDIKMQLKQQGLTGPGKIRVSTTGCLGRCDEGPVAVVYPKGHWYQYHSLMDLETIMKKDLIAGEKVEELALPD